MQRTWRRAGLNEGGVQISGGGCPLGEPGLSYGLEQCDFEHVVFSASVGCSAKWVQAFFSQNEGLGAQEWGMRALRDQGKGLEASEELLGFRGSPGCKDDPPSC